MTELTVVEKESEWRRLKRLVLDAVSSPITRRVYNLALDEFIEWYDKEGRCGFTKSTVNAWRSSLESRGLGSSSINGRLSAVRKLAHEAGDNGLLAPDVLQRRSGGLIRFGLYETEASGAVQGTTLRGGDHRPLRPLVPAVSAQLAAIGRDHGRAKLERRSRDDLALGPAIRTRTERPMPAGIAHDKPVMALR